MLEVFFNEIIYGNSFFYSLILMFILASFISSILIISFKTYKLIKNNYYTFLFEKDLWSQSLEKNIDNAKKWESLSTLVKMFSEGFKTFMMHHRKSPSYNSGSNINLTKNTMKVIMLRDQENLSQGFNILAFNSLFIPYSTISLSLFDIINVFMTVEIGVLSLSMFVKPLAILLLGLTLTGISTVLYCVYQSRLELEKEKFSLFIEEFGNFLHKNFYNGED